MQLKIEISRNKIKNNKSFEYKSDSSEKLEEAPKRLVASKKLTVSERSVAPRNNKRITKIETSRKEKKKIKSIRKDEENDNDDNEADEGDKADRVIVPYFSLKVQVGQHRQNY
ncbi:hypothetical protein Glove_216g3 [Diversispora epigaea]|uniref:Uncharacterized protein n=1 Tax=Diversispora epigaea TaxID=1348612 RepID=A0A397IJV5_9GLOM|nr:hypothetical protein Glove_216g3 [Diversispora epigaea]